MTVTAKAAALRRAAVLVLVAAAGTTPALANTASSETIVRVDNIAAPTSATEATAVRNRIAMAAERACGSDERSLPDYRYAVRHSDCFRTSYDTAMVQLQTRWGTTAASGAGMR